MPLREAPGPGEGAGGVDFPPGGLEEDRAVMIALIPLGLKRGVETSALSRGDADRFENVPVLGLPASGMGEVPQEEGEAELPGRKVVRFEGETPLAPAHLWISDPS